MTVCVTVEERFLRTPDGLVWTGVAGVSDYLFWKRYLDVFEQVHVIARVAQTTSAPQPTWKRADGESVTFHPLPHYIGPLQYTRKFLSLKQSIGTAINEADAIIMRVSFSVLAPLLERQLAPGRPFGLEVIGDPYDVFAPGSTQHPLRPFLRWRFSRQLKRQCRKACAVAYVTKETLQRRYPPNENAFSTAYSSIELEESALAPCPRVFTVRPSSVRLISIGTLEVLYKGFDILIDAVAFCIKEGIDMQLVIIGEGRCRGQFERHAQLCGLEHRITFTGRIPSGEAVRNELDRADLFVLASRAEGVPRAMIEAMARGVPCIGSAVGGLRELLDAEDLFPSGNAPALASKIREVLNEPCRMTRMSAVNLAKARNYLNSVLSSRRREFYMYVRQATLDWRQRLYAPDA